MEKRVEIMMPPFNYRLIYSILLTFQVIPRTPSLDNLTRDRPKPPSQRRPPSRHRTPSPSPTHTTGHSSSPFQQHHQHSKVERIGGITNTVQENGTQRVNNHTGSSVDATDSKLTQPVKEQWVSTSLWNFRYRTL